MLNWLYQLILGFLAVIAFLEVINKSIKVIKDFIENVKKANKFIKTLIEKIKNN